MRYHYIKPDMYKQLYGETYTCNHKVYTKCTLFKIDNNGLAVIQQRFNPKDKSTYWDAIDPWLSNEIYLHKRFKNIFDQRSGECRDGLYPTVTVRQLMWAIKMKPIPREPWETYFDRKLI